MRKRAVAADNSHPVIAESAQQFYRQLGGFFRRRIANASDAEDLAQEVFLRALRQRKDAGEIRNPAAWLFRIAQSVLVDHYRRAGRPTPDGVLLAAGEEEMREDTEIATCIEPLLSALPPTYREAVRTVDLEGVAQTDFAKTVSLSPSAARARVQRGRKKLREAFLACCQIETDRRGGVIGMERRSGCAADVPCDMVPDPMVKRR